MSIAGARRPWRRRLFFVGVTVIATVGCAAASAVLPGWAAGGLGVLVGIGATLAMDEWDDRHVPDFVATFEEALK